MSMNIGLSGEYNMVIDHADGSQTETGWFKNIVLNTGMVSVFDQQTYNLSGSYYSMMLGTCHVGDGTTTPSATQTGIVGVTKGSTVVAPGGAYSHTVGPAPDYVRSLTFKYQFAVGGVVGTVSEVVVGVARDLFGGGTTVAGGPSTYGGFSRSLISDSLGNPVTLTLAATDQLTVYYKLNIQPNASDVTGTVVLDGVTYSYIARPLTIQNWIPVTGYQQSYFQGGLFGSSAAASAITTSLGGTSATLASTTTAQTGLTSLPPSSKSYGVVTATATGYYRDTILAWAPDYGNVATGIKIMTLTNTNAAVSYQYEFTPPIPKLNTQTLSLTLRQSVDRA